MAKEYGGWVYVMTNRPNGTLYVGVTSNLARRIWEHREGVIDGFTQQYNLKRLVFAERHEDIRAAIQREKNIKHWSRAWKVTLIETMNPRWNDLYSQIA
jgi:putative endonuclease